MNWLEVLNKDHSKVDDFVTEYELHLKEAKTELGIDGHVEKLARQMPTITDKRFSQLQEIEAVLELFTIKLKKERSIHYKQYLEHYSRALTSRDVEKYIDGEPAVVDLMIIQNKIALIRNKFAGITKALEIKHFQITNIVKLKAAGLDDSDISFY